MTKRPKHVGPDAGTERKAKLVGIVERGRLAAERAKLLKLSREIEEGQWHRVDECEQQCYRRVRAMRDQVYFDHPRRFADKLARRLILLNIQGFDEGQLQRLIEGQLQGDIRVVLDWLANPNSDPSGPFPEKGTK